MTSIISSIGSYTPEETLSNRYFEQIVETSDEWIVKRTGIKTRRRANNETTVSMAKKAVINLRTRYNISLTDIDFIIFTSSTPEHKIPSLASQLQYELKIKNAGTFDLTAACAGFVYALIMAQSLINSYLCKKILVVASEILTRHTDYTDRSTCILFGDGASAVILESSPVNKIYKPVFGTEGQFGHVLYLNHYLTEMNGIPVNNNNKIIQDGKKVYKWAVATMCEKLDEILQKNDMTINDIDFFIPHSANLRIIESICDQTGIEKTKTLNSVINYGNTSAASIPLALDKAIGENIINKQSTLLLMGFGGGLTYAGTIIDFNNIQI